MKSILTRMVLFPFCLLLLSTFAQATEASFHTARESNGVATKKQSEATDETPLLMSETIGAKFIRISAGTFIMGGPGINESPQHQVTISKPFYLQETELTQGQWAEGHGA